jgi:hypothetical protein
MSILPTGFHAPDAPNFYLADETIPIPAGKKITLGTDGAGTDGTIQFNKDVDGLLFTTLGKQDISVVGAPTANIISLTNDLENWEPLAVERILFCGNTSVALTDAAEITGNQTTGLTSSAPLTVPQLNGVAPGSIFRATFTGALSVPSAAISTGTYVIWDTVDFDFVGSATAPFEDYVIPKTGYYRLYASAQYAANTTGVRQVAFRNTATNTTLDLFQGAPPGGGSSASVGLEGTYLFQENDSVQIWVGQNSGSPLNCTAARFEIQFVRAP